MKKEFKVTHVGRLVQGHPLKGNTTDLDGNPLVVKNGPNAGQPRTDYYIHVAFDKKDPKTTTMMSEFTAVATRDFPHLFANGQKPAKFSYKVTDGDSTTPNMKGNKPCDKEGHPGHFVIKFNSGFEPKVYSKGGEMVLTDPSSIKTGDYVRVQYSVVGNNSTANPGLYVNLSKVEKFAAGQEIVSVVENGDAFKEAGEDALPAGAVVMENNTPFDVPAAAMTDTVKPDREFVNQKLVLTEKATVSLEQYRSMNMTDETLIAAGLARYE